MMMTWDGPILGPPQSGTAFWKVKAIVTQTHIGRYLYWLLSSGYRLWSVKSQRKPQYFCNKYRKKGFSCDLRNPADPSDLLNVFAEHQPFYEWAVEGKVELAPSSVTSVPLQHKKNKTRRRVKGGAQAHLSCVFFFPLQFWGISHIDGLNCIYFSPTEKLS